MGKPHERKTNAMRVLDAAGIAYEFRTFSCEQALSGVEVARLLGLDPARVFKTLVTVGKSGEKEIDFIGEKKGNKLYIQVTYLLASEDTIRREFGAYDTIRDNFPKYVVSMDDLDMSRDGIKHRNIRDFLQMPRWE